MQSGIRTHYFLGADSRHGYCSLYGDISSSARCETQYIIKGGHSFGKSVFIGALSKHLIEAGYDIECFHSTINIDNLDGILIPALKTSFLDGELPHVVNARYPGAVETYVDLGAFYDSSVLRKEREQIITLTGEIKSGGIRLSRYLSAAGEIRDNISSIIRSEKIISSIQRRAKSTAAREFRKTGNSNGCASYRFLTASAGSGNIYDYSSVTTQCKRVCVLDNDLWLSHEMLSVLKESAISSGYDVTVCLDPLEPDKAEHLIIRDLSLAYVSRKHEHPYSGDIYKHFRLDAMPRESLDRASKLKVKSDRKLFYELIQKGDQTQSDISRLYNELESIYTPCLNMDGISMLALEYSNFLIH